MIRKTRLYHFVVYGVRDSAVLIFSLFLLGAIAVLILEVSGKLKLPEFVDDAEEVTRSSSLALSASEMTTTTLVPSTSTQLPLETGLLLIDVKCLQRFLLQKPCIAPVLLATNENITAQLVSLSNSGYASIATYDDDDAKDYLLFNTEDGDRAVVRYNVTKQTITLDSGTQLSVFAPADAERFIRHWRRGRFLPCHPVLIREANITRTIPLNFSSSIAAFRDFCDAYNVTCFLFDGGLLGWYRECSIIPHTLDIDFAAYSSEHSEEFLQAIIDSKEFRLKWILGRLRDSLEFMVTTADHNVDLFYVYEDEQLGLEYTAGMNFRGHQQVRWYRPKIRGICAGDLLDKLVYVPCNPVDMLKVAYGPRWFEDHPTSRFNWMSSPKNVVYGEFYASTEWPLVIRKFFH